MSNSRNKGIITRKCGRGGYSKIYSQYLDCVEKSRVYYIRKIAEKIYNPNLSDLDNWLKAEKEFDNPDFILLID